MLYFDELWDIMDISPKRKERYMINCTKHPDREASGMCVSCGKPFCEECLSEVKGKNYCKTCLAETIELLQKRDTSRPKTSSKKKGVAILLWIFFGGLGAHRFYIGRTWTGLMMLLLWAFNTVIAVSSSLTILGGLDPSAYLAFLSSAPLAWIALIAHGIWCFVDIIQLLTNLLTDSHGRSLM